MEQDGRPEEATQSLRAARTHREAASDAGNKFATLSAEHASLQLKLERIKTRLQRHGHEAVLRQSEEEHRKRRAAVITDRDAVLGEQAASASAMHDVAVRIACEQAEAEAVGNDVLALTAQV